MKIISGHRLRDSIRGAAIVALFGSVALAAGCASLGPAALRAPAPVPAAASKSVEIAAPAPPAAVAAQVPEALLKEGATITLTEVVDVALQNNPVTRASYLQARSAAAQFGSKRAAYYPALDLSASASRASQSLYGQPAPTLNSYGPAVSLSFLLFDLGGRAGNAEDARQALLAADFTHNATINNVVFGVQQTYFLYLNAKAQLEAAEVTVKLAQTALDAASRRHDAGVATIAEVLQAKTALSQAQLARASVAGQVQAVRGALATAMGLPANTPYDVGTLPGEVPIDSTGAAVDQLIGTARAKRPDLAAQRAFVDKALAHVRAVKSEGLPIVSLSATAGRQYFDPALYANAQNSWAARLLVTYPLFTGFANSYNVEKARRDAEAAQALADTLDQQVVLQVWTSYYALETARELVKASRDLLASAEQSERVARGRYKEGVGTILDLLTAQSALAAARAQDIQARSAWLIAVAQLARDTGTAPSLDQTIGIAREGGKP